jgi:hypothetical protein
MLLNLEEFHNNQLSLAAQVLADNLILHQRHSLAKLLLETVQVGGGYQLIQNHLQKLVNECQVYYEFYNERRLILGLAGLQYREFFTSLIPAYAEIGVEGAKEYMDWLKTDEDAAAALRRLKHHYGNEKSVREVVLDI